MKKINGLPLYRATVGEGDGTGMFVVSLVESPAVETDFLAFAKQEVLQFKVEDEEQHKVLGVVMRPNFPMYRETEAGEGYYIEYDANTIHQMAEKFFRNCNVNSVDTDHSFELVDGVTLSQAFFKNEAKGINPAGFEDLPDDTLFFEYHITSDEIWDGVKDGTWKGFSLAGTFNIEPVEFSMKVEDKATNVLDEIEGMIDIIKNKLK
jgi:hypothetical protein